MFHSYGFMTSDPVDCCPAEIVLPYDLSLHFFVQSPPVEPVPSPFASINGELIQMETKNLICCMLQ